MSVLDHAEFDQHESVHFFTDPASGLRAIIALHSTALGPAAGGCRRWVYPTTDDAVTDVLRLSRGMTYKNAVAGLPFGGGKAVILAKPKAEKNAAMFRAFGRIVESLQGRYVTAEDVGISVEDMRVVNQETRYVSGLPQAGNSAGGDPSPWTALGVFLGMTAAAKSRLSADSVKGLRVAVQGVGNVGHHLCHLLHDAGATLLVADVNRNNLQRLASDVPVEIVPPTEILFSDVDILAPCALGNIIDAQTAANIKAKIVAGAANNQLATDADGMRLADRGILYAPDYVINAGGIISVAREYLGSNSEQQVRDEISGIPQRLSAIFEESKKTGRATNLLADSLARSIVSGANTDLPATAVNSQSRH